MNLQGNVMVSIWHILGSPSWISAILSIAVTFLSWIAKRLYSKIKELNKLHQEFDLLKQEVKSNKEMLNQRIDDLKDEI